MPSITSVTNTATPVSQSERIIILDSLRGIAILGILLMNIPGFALPAPAMLDPSVLNEWGTINFKAWYVIEWVMEGSQRALFSMLFGAGIILFINRQEKRREGLWPSDYFFRRQLWLLVFGLFHAFILLWFWDILFAYACCGMILFAFRRLSTKHLLLAAGVCLLLMTLRENADLYRDKAVIHRGELVAQLDTTATKLTGQQTEHLNEMTSIKEKSSVESKKKKMESNLEKVKGDYATFYRYQSERSFHVETHFFYKYIWDLLLFMFLGMAFYKNGVLTGNASSKVYWFMATFGLAAGLFLTWVRLQPSINYRFNEFDYAKNVRFEMYELSRVLRSLGIFALITLLYKSGWFKWLFALMRPVGQMAFTNYLAQSLLCGLFFYGIGFGMYGELQRYEIYYVVLAVWMIEIAWSHAWLRYFRFGPLEWLWRSLTYWKVQPLKKERNSDLTLDKPLN